MSKLLFVFERDMPTVSITREVFAHLECYPEIQSDFMYLADVKPSDIDMHDVIVFMRPDNVYAWKLAKNARLAGHVAVTFSDDDLLNLPCSFPTIPWRKKGLMKTLANSDVIWTSSRNIAEKYKGLTAGKRSALIDTIIRPDELSGIKAACNDKVKIVYAAAPSHAHLFEKYIAPIAPQLAEDFDVSFTFVGVHPNVPGVECEYVTGMPLLEYRNYMKASKFDIGLAPLDGDDFSKCKYFNKFIEYTTQGIVGVYSNTEPYTYVVKDGETGFLAGDLQDWQRALREAVQSKEKREVCVENAVEYLRREHAEEACINRIRQGLPEIIEANGKYKKCKDFKLQKVVYYLSRPMDWAYLMVFNLKHTGIKSVIEKTKRHFIKAKVYSRRAKS